MKTGFLFFLGFKGVFYCQRSKQRRGDMENSRCYGPVSSIGKELTGNEIGQMVKNCPSCKKCFTNNMLVCVGDNLFQCGYCGTVFDGDNKIVVPGNHQSKREV
jgi:ribosomal protein L37AE/L43A